MMLLRESLAFDLRVVVTGMHLAAEFGSTVEEVERSFPVAARVPILQDGDDAGSAAKAFGHAAIGLGDAFRSLAPDLVMLLGDRYEIAAAGAAAHLMQRPIAHLCGGDVTEGAIDDAMRHALTKLSQLHFVSTETAGRRVRQLGEQEDRIFVVGSPGIDAIARATIPSRDEFFVAVEFAPRATNLLVTFHPTTLGADANEGVDELLMALDSLGPDTGLLFTSPNVDPSGRAILRRIEEFVATHRNAQLVKSLGHQLYYAAVKHCDAVVGNSSSGLYEAPTLKRATVNIGDRQRGRERAASVIDCAPRTEAIKEAIQTALRLDCSGVTNPYGDGRSSEKIVEQLERVPDFQALLRKRFVDLRS